MKLIALVVFFVALAAANASLVGGIHAGVVPGSVIVGGVGHLGLGPLGLGGQGLAGNILVGPLLAGSGLEGQYVPDHSELLYDDGSYRLEHHLGIGH